ncbi:hypothetical protein [Actinomadura opuntiae]|uniref:hypothetical protein n=1 Tax=Actinomadura sp. OS1-43 TaxID=604315 RepID=UPI00255AAADE|nr:hypothetical protein [Actinomadura sp. OS1-43]MDL4821638.1 hypothetical protein [Actinomadura sp. OS1-43]
MSSGGASSPVPPLPPAGASRAPPSLSVPGVAAGSSRPPDGPEADGLPAWSDAAIGSERSWGRTSRSSAMPVPMARTDAPTVAAIAMSGRPPGRPPRPRRAAARRPAPEGRA